MYKRQVLKDPSAIHHKLAKEQVYSALRRYRYIVVSSINTSLIHNSITFNLAQDGSSSNLGIESPLEGFNFQFLIDAEQEKTIFYLSGHAYFEQPLNMEINQSNLKKEMRKILDQRLNNYAVLQSFNVIGN